MDVTIRPYSHPRDMEELWRVFNSATHIGRASSRLYRDFLLEADAAYPHRQ
jgi:hypothetical protein